MRGLFASKDESLKEDLSVNEKRDALDKINTEGGYAAHDLENIAKKYQPDAKSLNDWADEVVEKVYSDIKNDFFNKLKIYGDDADLDNILYDVFNANESLKEDLMRSSWGSDFGSDVYNALADIAFKYYKKDINITEDDWAEAIEWFMTHFFEDEQIYEESLKEDLMDTAWGSNFKSDVYNALSKIAFKYYRKNINVTDDDWDEAIEWFMTHFFESDDNPFDESLTEGDYDRPGFEDMYLVCWDDQLGDYH